MSTLNYYWRLIATAISFACFGLGGLIVPILALPVMLLVRDQDRREQAMKWIVHKGFWVFMRLMRGLGVCTFEVTGLQKLRQPGQLILANHPTLIDVVLLISLLPKADCVVKSALLRNPFTRGPLKAARYIANDTAEQLIDEASASMARGNSLVIFPEGTRTTPGKPLKLQRGAANIAVRTANNIRPVIIKCRPSTLTKQEPWYRIPERRFHISIRVDESIAIAPYLEQAPSVAARTLSQDLASYFTQETA